MPVERSSVSFDDEEGVTHTAHVQAESLYEAVVLGIVQFRENPMVPRPDKAAEFTVSIQRPAVQHRIRLEQIVRWAENFTTKEGPACITKRARVKSLTGSPERSSAYSCAPYGERQPPEPKTGFEPAKRALCARALPLRYSGSKSILDSADFPPLRALPLICLLLRFVLCYLSRRG